jgi:erythromycin esterase-like protein
MWANREVCDFLDWLREWNRSRPEQDRVGFYGLDVYSLWDSLRATMTWLEAHAPDALSTAMQAWQCFLPYGEDPHQYAWSTRLVPTSCESDVVALLAETRRRARDLTRDTTGDPTRDGTSDESAFDAAQNAEVVTDAEHYYRIMVRGDRQSWNIRDVHMADTIDRLAEHLGAGSKGLVWEHNTHVGDARATDMATAGLVTVGQLVRERHAGEGVALVGFASHRGSVIAAAGWGDPSSSCRCRWPVTGATRTCSTVRSTTTRCSCSVTTGRGHGCRRGWVIERSGWSTTRLARRATTSRR